MRFKDGFLQDQQQRTNVIYATRVFNNCGTVLRIASASSFLQTMLVTREGARPAALRDDDEENLELPPGGGMSRQRVYRRIGGCGRCIGTASL